MFRTIKKWEPGVVVENATTPRSDHFQTERGTIGEIGNIL